jgi:hypothetical protein
MCSQRGSSFLEVLIAVAVFSAVFAVVVRTFAVSALSSGMSGVRSEVVREANNELVKFHLPDSFVLNRASMLERSPVGWTDVSPYPDLQIGNSKVIRNIRIEKISPGLYEIELFSRWTGPKGSPAGLCLSTVMKI